MLRRAKKLRTAQDGRPEALHWIAPKGMWQQTYQRDRFEIEWPANQGDQHFLSKFNHFLSAEDREMFFGL